MICHRVKVVSNAENSPDKAKQIHTANSAVRRRYANQPTGINHAISRTHPTGHIIAIVPVVRFVARRAKKYLRGSQGFTNINSSERRASSSQKRCSYTLMKVCTPSLETRATSTIEAAPMPSHLML